MRIKLCWSKGGCWKNQPVPSKLCEEPSLEEQTEIPTFNYSGVIPLYDGFFLYIPISGGRTRRFVPLRSDRGPFPVERASEFSPPRGKTRRRASEGGELWAGPVAGGGTGASGPTPIRNPREGIIRD